MKLGKFPKAVVWVAAFLVLASVRLSAQNAKLNFMEGDILFQAINTPQNLALAMATGSEYTHCGIVFKRENRYYVYEALGIMSLTPIEDFIKRSQVPVLQYRLKNPSALTPEVLEKMKSVARSFANKLYDYRFLWSDDKIYCSEMIYKIYQRGAGIELAPLKGFNDYNLTHPAVRALVEKRFPKGFPDDEKVIAPVDLLNSPELKRIEKIPMGGGK
jgi:hypothetical protein